MINPIAPHLIEAGRKVVNLASQWHTRQEACFQWPTEVGQGQEWSEDGSEKLLSGPEVTSYHYYPFLFKDVFPQVSVEDIHQVALAGYFYSEYLLLQDRLLDNQIGEHDPKRCQTFLTTGLLHEEALAILAALFPADSSFWSYLHDYHQEFTRAVFIETVKHHGRISPYPAEEQRQIAIGKAAIAKTATAALAVLAGDEDKIAHLADSQDWAALGFQLYDDLQDWKKDYEQRRFSPILHRLIQEKGLAEAVLSANRPETKTIGQILYYSGLAEETLNEANYAYEQAINCVASLDCPHWMQHIQLLQDNCKQLQADLADIVHKTVESFSSRPRFELTLPPARDEWQAIAWDALDFITKQWQQGFAEARHIMHLSSSEGFSAAKQYHYGDIFQRALIADALCDAEDALPGSIQPVIDYEIDYLLNSRLSTGVGGWSYFPTVPEVAPDADDMGQIMQVLLRAGHHKDVDEYCQTPLNVLLHDNTRPDGSIETWIVPATGRTPQQERQAMFNQTKWGVGPDNEVMANLLYALALYEPVRFAPNIQRGVAFLEGRQEADGSWNSKWYYGPYYGTYVCLRLLANVQPNSPAIHSALHFLQNNQMADGGWSQEDGQSDPLSTSLALLGLAAIQNHHSSDLAQIHQGLMYLKNSQEADKSWPAAPFIRPRANDPHESRTMTCLYVLKAALTWHELCAPLASDEEKATLNG